MKRHHLRIAPVALAAVLVIGACGSDDPGATDTVPAPGDDSSDEASGEMLAPRPIELAEQSSGGRAVTATAESADAPAIDMMLPFAPTEYVIGDDLGDLPTDDVGYVYQAGTEVSADQVAELAAAFGLDDEPVRIDEEYTQGWRVGPDDGTAPSLWIQEDAQLNWNYSGVWEQDIAAVSCESTSEPMPVAVPASTVSVAPDTAVTTIPERGNTEESFVEACEAPAPPEGVPSADEAEALTRDLVAALGADPAGYEFEAWADDWYANVTAIEQVDGSPAGRRVDVGFGGGATIQYASGQLAEPAIVGPYLLVDLDTAVQRLNDQQYGWAAASRGGGMIEPAIEDAGSTSEIAQTEPGVDMPEVPVSSPMPVEPPIDAEPYVATLVDVEADFWWAWDVDNSVWLLPAYRFIDADGGWHVVPAVTDEFLVQADTVEDPAPAPETTVPPPTTTLVPTPDTSVVPTTMPLDTVPVKTTPESVPVDTITPPQSVDGSGDEETVALVEVIDDVAFYPACMNEPVTVNGTVWYPVVDWDDGQIAQLHADITSVRREQPAGPNGFARVAAPGPGDDIGTLTVWADGVAHFVSDSGLEAWLVDDELTYNWVC